MRRPLTTRRARSSDAIYSCVTIQLIDRPAAVCCRGEDLELRELTLLVYLV